MAKRLATRLSAGAALVTGLGMIGIATAVPAQAETSLKYSCTTPLGDQVLDVTLDTDAPASAVVDDALSVTPSGTVTLNNQISNAMAGALQWESVSADIPNVEAVLSDGTTDAPFTTDLSIAKTQIYDADNGGWTSDDTPDLPITGPATDVTPTVVGTYTISAPATFNVTFKGFNAAGEAGTLSPIDSTCTYVSGDKVIDTVTVTDAPTEPPAPEVDDWFTEPESLPITSDGKSFTVAGPAAHAGTMTVVLLDSDKKVLKTYTWDLAEGDNTKDFAFVDGTDYVRLVSSECVDADGNDESVVGSGCNAEYRASWADDGDTNTGTGDDDDDSGTGSTPEIPDVVQTDGFQRVPAAGDDNGTALLLGGALLAGAGASIVVIARRRKGAQL